MIFWVLIVFVALFFLVGIWAVVYLLHEDPEATPLGILAFIPFLAVGIPAWGIWTSHANDLGTIEAQHEVIAVYQERVNRLTERLDGFDYPEQGAALLLNADSPVRSIVQSLTEAEAQLAEAEAEKARAIRSIEQRRRGPWSGVITMAGDYR